MQPLTFVASIHHRKLMFKATTLETEVVVKLVKDKYGRYVHETLAEQGLAPKLLGVESVAGAPKAIVMEILQEPLPLPGGTGWKTLHKFAKRSESAQYANAVWRELETVLETLRRGNMVHGDLRSYNVMIRVDDQGMPVMVLPLDEDGRVSLKVVDFDWSGTSGQVRYPRHRNEDITWAGEAGAPIKVKHDRRQAAIMFRELFPGSEVVVG